MVSPLSLFQSAKAPFLWSLHSCPRYLWPHSHPHYLFMAPTPVHAIIYGPTPVHAIYLWPHSCPCYLFMAPLLSTLFMEEASGLPSGGNTKLILLALVSRKGCFELEGHLGGTIPYVMPRVSCLTSADTDGSSVVQVWTPLPQCRVLHQTFPNRSSIY